MESLGIPQVHANLRKFEVLVDLKLNQILRLGDCYRTLRER
jgi:hypothetical protein